MTQVRRGRTRWLRAAHGAILLTALAVTTVTSRASDWEPAWLLPALLATALVSDALALRLKSLRISGSFSALVLAMALLGPGPAVLLGLIVVGIDATRSKLTGHQLTANLAAYAAFPLAGALLWRGLEPSLDGPLEEGAAVLLVFGATIALNFLLIYGDHAVATGASLIGGIRDVFVPVLPAELGTALLTAGLVVVYETTGAGAVGVLAAIVLIFQYLLRFALDASDRGEQLHERNQELASLQVGLISTMLKTLSLRDNMTARHSAAVARYSREMAKALGLDEREQELVHTAALFHDIGKFIFPDSILLTDRRLSDEDFDVVKRHPAVGADLIAEIDGYGPVADIVRSHHERIDGRGYPDGLCADAIPIGSRILAVADTYDVITARDTYRKPISVAEAVAELRRVAGVQLDAHLVEIFVHLVEEGGVRFRHGSEADFEAELSLQRRVREYAEPRAAA